MEITSSKGKDFIPQKMKVMLMPLGLLSIMIVLILIIFKVGVSRIGTQRTDLQKATKNETILGQKQVMQIRFSTRRSSWLTVKTLE